MRQRIEASGETISIRGVAGSHTLESRAEPRPPGDSRVGSGRLRRGSRVARGERSIVPPLLVLIRWRGFLCRCLTPEFRRCLAQATAHRLPQEQETVDRHVP